MINASYLKRFLAFVTDLILIDLFLLTPFGSLIIKKTGITNPGAVIDYVLTHPQIMGFLSVIGFIVVVVSLLYFVLFEYLLNQTIGMMIFSLYITQIKNKSSLWRCMLRNLFLIPYPLFQIIAIIDIIHLFYSADGQRLTERLVGSKIVMPATMTQTT